MALTTSTITGRVPLPNDSPPTAAEVIFELVGFDTEGADTIPPTSSVRYAVNPGTGQLPAGAVLWRNTQGTRGTVYRVTVRWSERDRGRLEVKSAPLGYVQVGSAASYTLPDLLATQAQPSPGIYRAVTQEEWEIIESIISTGGGGGGNPADIAALQGRMSAAELNLGQINAILAAARGSFGSLASRLADMDARIIAAGGSDPGPVDPTDPDPYAWVMSPVPGGISFVNTPTPPDNPAASFTTTPGIGQLSFTE